MKTQPTDQSSLTVKYRFHFKLDKGSKKIKKGKTKRKLPEPTPEIPKVTRLLALAHYYQRLIDDGRVKDYAEIARLTGVSRARVTQVMNLTFLAPEIQKALLCSPLSQDKRTERSVRKLAEIILWEKQVRKWKDNILVWVDQLILP